MEIKSVEVLAPVHRKQLLTYVQLADKRLGLLINFHVALIKDGITRIVTGLEAAKKRRGRYQRPVGLRSKTSLEVGTSRVWELEHLQQSCRFLNCDAANVIAARADQAKMIAFINPDGVASKSLQDSRAATSSIMVDRRLGLLFFMQPAAGEPAAIFAPSPASDPAWQRQRVTIRQAYGFRTYRVLERALYQSLTMLPEPESTHDISSRLNLSANHFHPSG